MSKFLDDCDRQYSLNTAIWTTDIIHKQFLPFDLKDSKSGLSPFKIAYGLVGNNSHASLIKKYVSEILETSEPVEILHKDMSFLSLDRKNKLLNLVSLVNEGEHFYLVMYGDSDWYEGFKRHETTALEIPQTLSVLLNVSKDDLDILSGSNAANRRRAAVLLVWNFVYAAFEDDETKKTEVLSTFASSIFALDNGISLVCQAIDDTIRDSPEFFDDIDFRAAIRIRWLLWRSKLEF